MQLTKEDIETILNTLIYDGKLERSIIASAGAAGDSSGQTKLYRAVNPLVETTGLMRMPCGSCPVSTVAFNVSPNIQLLNPAKILRFFWSNHLILWGYKARCFPMVEKEQNASVEQKKIMLCL